MGEQEFIAERKLHAIAADGGEIELHIGIGKPYAISIDEWACPVMLEGLHSNLRDQHGIDSWQAMQLSYQLISQLLAYFVQDGGQLFWEKGGGSVLLSELIPKTNSF